MLLLYSNLNSYLSLCAYGTVIWRELHNNREVCLHQRCCQDGFQRFLSDHCYIMSYKLLTKRLVKSHAQQCYSNSNFRTGIHFYVTTKQNNPENPPLCKQCVVCYTPNVKIGVQKEKVLQNYTLILNIFNYTEKDLLKTFHDYVRSCWWKVVQASGQRKQTWLGCFEVLFK